MVCVEEISKKYSSEGLTSEVILLFRQLIQDFYSIKRRSFPWRDQVSDYGVFVSEVMLQQTQAPRVIEKYISFLQRFPNFESLASASVKEVLELWQGLGYNRRALALHEASREIVHSHKGTLPRTLPELDKLPGIGPASACSISAFAFNAPVVFIETNIRSVFLHVFFQNQINISDQQLLPLVEATLDRNNSREWYSALMDYGAFLKKQANPNLASKHYTKQSSFKGSRRELRGNLLRKLLEQAHSFECLHSLYPDARLEEVLEHLIRERMIVFKKGKYSLP